MKKNLIIYVEDPRFGGPHQYTICILNELKKNFNIKLLTSNKENKIFLKKLNLKKVNIKTLPLSFLSLILGNILSYVFFFIYEIFYTIVVFPAPEGDEKTYIPPFLKLDIIN